MFDPFLQSGGDWRHVGSAVAWPVLSLPTIRCSHVVIRREEKTIGLWSAVVGVAITASHLRIVSHGCMRFAYSTASFWYHHVSRARCPRDSPIVSDSRRNLPTSDQFPCFAAKNAAMPISFCGGACNEIGK